MMSKKQFDEMFRSEFMPSIWRAESKYDVWSLDNGLRTFEYDCAIDSAVKCGTIPDRDRGYARPRWLHTLRPSSLWK